MIDYHCHLDLYPNLMRIFGEANMRNAEILAVTTSPRAFVKTLQHFKGSHNVRVALGFHPELVAQRPTEKDLFFEQMKSIRFIGEIGIDGSRRMKESVPEQKDFFRNVVQNAAIIGGQILSIHSRGAVKDVLQILEQHEGNYIPILHWFTGSIKEADKAIELGCWFSINPNMCYTDSGKRIIDVLPFDRILPETDAPFTQRNGAPYMPWDMTVATYISRLKNISIEETESLFFRNLQHLEG